MSAKKKMYSSAYNPDWVEECPIGPVKGNTGQFFCIPCKTTVSCEYQGRKDVERHCAPLVEGRPLSFHNKNVDSVKNARRIGFVSQSSFINDQVTKSEILHTEFLVQHNIPLNAAAHLPKLYKVMFPDSQIAKSFACSRTKSTAILNEAMMPDIHDYICAAMRNYLFALINVGSSNQSLKKINALCVAIYDIDQSSKVSIRFIFCCIQLLFNN